MRGFSLIFKSGETRITIGCAGNRSEARSPTGKRVIEVFPSTSVWSHPNSKCWTKCAYDTRLVRQLLQSMSSAFHTRASRPSIIAIRFPIQPRGPKPKGYHGACVAGDEEEDEESDAALPARGLCASSKALHRCGLKVNGSFQYLIVLGMKM